MSQCSRSVTPIATVSLPGTPLLSNRSIASSYVQRDPPSSSSTPSAPAAVAPTHHGGGVEEKGEGSLNSSFSHQRTFSAVNEQRSRQQRNGELYPKPSPKRGGTAMGGNGRSPRVSTPLSVSSARSTPVVFTYGDDNSTNTSPQLRSPTTATGAITTSTSSSSWALHVADRRPSHWDKIPYELQLAILVLALDLSGGPKPIASFALVSRHWNRLCSEPYLWDHLAKQFFVAFPLVHRLTASSVHRHNRSLSDSGTSENGFDGSSSTGGGSAGDEEDNGNSRLRALLTTAYRALPGNVSVGLRRRKLDFSTSPKEKEGPYAKPSQSPLIYDAEPLPKFSAPRPTRRTFISRLADVEMNQLDSHHQQLVRKRRGPVLHAFVSGALFCFSMSGLVGMLALEGVEPSNALNVETCFGFLWAAYTFVFAAVISNVVMKAHFEPQPLVPRLKRHMKLIYFSAAVLAVTLFTIALPLFLVQQNVFRLIEVVTEGLPAEARPSRMDWLKAAAPILLGLLAWLAEVCYSVRDQFHDWISDGAPVTFQVLYDTSAHCTPLFFIIAALSAVEATVNPESSFHLALGTGPLFVVFITLSFVFITEYRTHRRPLDLVSCICLFVASLFPIGLITFPLRGLSMLPLVVASSGFYLAHLNEMRKRMSLLEAGGPPEQLMSGEDDSE